MTGEQIQPVAVCAGVVAALRAAIRRDWARATQDMRRLDGTYAEWFRGRDASVSMAEFQRRWAHGGVLCSVSVGHAGQVHVLQLRFSLGCPVPAPDLAVDVPAFAPASAFAAAQPFVAGPPDPP